MEERTGLDRSKLIDARDANLDALAVSLSTAGATGAALPHRACCSLRWTFGVGRWLLDVWSSEALLAPSISHEPFRKDFTTDLRNGRNPEEKSMLRHCSVARTPPTNAITVLQDMREIDLSHGTHNVPGALLLRGTGSVLCTRNCNDGIQPRLAHPRPVILSGPRSCGGSRRISCPRGCSHREIPRHRLP